jgi:hypothetical protein
MKYEKAIQRVAEEKRAGLSKLSFYDANVWLGKPAFFPLAGGCEVGGLHRMLDEFSIRGALVSHWEGVTISAQDGNRALIKAAEMLPDSVYTVWTGLPPVPRENGPLPGFSTPDVLLRGVRVFPKTHRYLLTVRSIGGLCEWCLEYRVPLFIWHVEVDWELLHVLAREYPGLSIIVESQWQKILYQNRNLYGIMDANKNIYHEISNFAGPDFLTHAVRTFGAGRFLYGSFLPVNDPYAAMGMIVDADISLEEKRLIAGGNLKRIIEGVKI